MFNWLDYIIIAIIGLSTLIGIARGFFREALSLTTWIASFWVSIHYAPTVSLLLQPYFSSNTIRIASAFAILFILTLIAGSMVSFIMTRMVSKAGLGGFDRMLGILFGMARGVLFVAALLILGRVIIPTQDPVWQRSLLAAYFYPLETSLLGFLPNNLHMQLQQAVSTVQTVQAVQNLQQNATHP